MAKKAAERDMADVESGRSTAAHRGVTGAGIEDRGDVDGGNAAGRSDTPTAAGHSGATSAVGTLNAPNGAGRLDTSH